MARRLAKRFLSREEFAKAPQSGAALYKFYQPTIAPVDETRTIRFTISTAGVDRDNDSIAAGGWDLRNYQKNPVVLWAHQYDQLPVGRAKNLRIENDTLVADAEFVSGDVYPFAETVFRMLKAGFLGSTSVGFKPKDFTYNEKRQGFDFSTQELLEFSIVPIPANPDALMDLRAAGILDDSTIEAYTKWAESALTVTKGQGDWRLRATPASASVEPSDMATRWSHPRLGDFTATAWTDLPKTERAKIAEHYAWADQYPPETFESLRFPHHDPKTGRPVWRGVVQAFAELLSQPGDLTETQQRAVYDHLVAHATAFGKTAPEFAHADSALQVVMALQGAEAMKSLPGPEADETEEAFVSRCMGSDMMQEEFDDQKQRLAVCYAQYREHKAVVDKSPVEADPAPPLATKIGRVLAGRNEARLRQAAGLLTEVLAELDVAAPTEEPKAVKDMDTGVLVLDDEPVSDEDVLAGLDPTDVKALLIESVKASVGQALDGLLAAERRRTTGELD